MEGTKGGSRPLSGVDGTASPSSAPIRAADEGDWLDEESNLIPWVDDDDWPPDWGAARLGVP